MDRPRRTATTEAWQRKVAAAFKTALRTHVLTIVPEIVSCQDRRSGLIEMLNAAPDVLKTTQIVRMSTSMEPRGHIDKETMQDLLRLLSHPECTVWGLNLGECICDQSAWVVFKEKLPSTLVGFVWINETGKDCGLDKETHKAWLSDATGILCGPKSILRYNRCKIPTALTALPRPWHNPKNPVLRQEVARKFLHNPTSESAYKEEASRIG